MLFNAFIGQMKKGLLHKMPWKLFPQLCGYGLFTPRGSMLLHTVLYYLKA